MRPCAVPGAPTPPAAAAELADRLAAAPGRLRLESSDIDTDADLHRRTYLQMLAGPGVDRALASALYAAGSDTALNPLACDALPCLHSPAAPGVPAAAG
ncbi:hypothetical protein, partial [Streptomonospora wellingtoniae]